MPSRSAMRFGYAVVSCAAALVLAACGGSDHQQAGQDSAVDSALAASEATGSDVSRALADRRVLSSPVIASTTLAAFKVFDAPVFRDRARGSVLWFDATSGTTALWYDGVASAGNPRGGAILTHPHYRVVGSADLNGDSRSDLIWYDANADETTVWIMQDVAPVRSYTLARGIGHRVIGTPDLDGDGVADLLWLNQTTGATTVWSLSGNPTCLAGADERKLAGAARSSYLMKCNFENKGLFVTGSRTLLVHPSFRVIALPDLDGNRKTDLVWHDPVTGQTVAWLMNGTAYASGVTLLQDVRFRVVATPDLDGNGRSDILWRDVATGVHVAWLMNGLSLVGGTTLAAPGRFKVLDTPDFNGDDRSDLLWFDPTTGDTAIWLMNGLATIGGGTVRTGLDFSPVGVADFNNDGRADILWYGSAQRTTVAWVSNASPSYSGQFSGAGLLADSPFAPIP